MRNRNRNLAIVVAIATAIGAAVFQSTAGHEAQGSREVVLVTHDSFVMSKELVAEFEKSSGLKLTLIKAGDTGSLTNRLILTKDAPIADAVFGIDNTYASQAQQEKIVDGDFTPIDFGYVCLNYDKEWFSTHHMSVPTSISMLTRPTYKNLVVVENPRTSSPGMAFLAATVDKFGQDGWKRYWTGLKANNVKIVDSWDAAYYSDFSGSTGHGAYPIVLSYSTSPVGEASGLKLSKTGSFYDGCFKQTEYAGVLSGAKNSANAQALVKFLSSTDFQKSIPESMFMYPHDTSITLPPSWAINAHPVPHPYGENLDFGTKKESWLTAWSAIFE